MDWRIQLQVLAVDSKGREERVNIFEVHLNRLFIFREVVSLDVLQPAALQLLKVDPNLSGPAKFSAVDEALTNVVGATATARFGPMKRAAVPVCNYYYFIIITASLTGSMFVFDSR